MALTLAYMVPMAMGWPQPQTAATTVMLIAATSAPTESLQKGILRIIGTLAGCIIGLSLIALFPQDRMVYLLAVSVTVSIIFYLFSCYKGDNSVFMLTAVVTLMVFNGGDADGAFLYGVERAFMTAFGVIVYTVIGAILWPVKSAANIQHLARDALQQFSQAYTALSQGSPGPGDSRQTLLDAEESFLSLLARNKNDSLDVKPFIDEWNAIASIYQRMQALLLPALQLEENREQDIDYGQFINDFPSLTQHLESQFETLIKQWDEQTSIPQPTVLSVDLHEAKLRQQSHLLIAAVLAKQELLLQLQQLQLELAKAMGSLLADQPGFQAGAKPNGSPSFVWLDLESFKTSIRTFCTFWIACAIWIQFNPPGGFMFVTFSTILVVLVSYTPVTAKILIVLFSVSFLFAIPAYIFLLPAMTHWIELSIFLFAYAFFGFYLFKGPVAIFFLLGLFTLGIQNQMNYSLQLMLLIVLMMYAVCAMQIITLYFPFTSRQERLYNSARRRFFKSCTASFAQLNAKSSLSYWYLGLQADRRSQLIAKMNTWGAGINLKLFPDCELQHITALNHSCEQLNAQLETLNLRYQKSADNPLLQAFRKTNGENPLAGLCAILAENNNEEAIESSFEAVGHKSLNIRQQLDQAFAGDPFSKYSPEDVAQLYRFIGLQASLFNCLKVCRDTQAKIPWPQLAETRF